MRDLAEIKRVNRAKNVGDKLGAENGNSSRPYDRQKMTYQRIETSRFKAPWDVPDPIDPEPVAL